MKKQWIILAITILMVFMLSGCACKHEWTEATCLTPKTCTKCEETEGEALGHSFADADCVTPKTCSVCSATEGEALGHTFVDADCVTPKTCSVCAATEGEALGHTWVDADCVTPKTCSVCAATEGEALGHTFVDADCVTPKTCSVCAVTEGEALGHTWTDATFAAPKTCSLCAVTEGEALMTDVQVKDVIIPLPTGWTIRIESDLYVATDENGQYMIGVHFTPTDSTTADFAIPDEGDTYCNERIITAEAGHDIVMYESENGSEQRFIFVHNGYLYDYCILIDTLENINSDPWVQQLREYSAIHSKIAQ